MKKFLIKKVSDIRMNLCIKFDSIASILAGAPIQGYFFGNKSGHYLNNLLLKTLFVKII